MAKINLTIPSVDKDKAQQELSYILIQESQLIEPLWSTIGQFVLKSHTCLPTDPATCSQKRLVQEGSQQFYLYLSKSRNNTNVTHVNG